eukprot:1160968-Pelagomonas_calceolata.AAC.5
MPCQVWELTRGCARTWARSKQGAVQAEDSSITARPRHLMMQTCLLMHKLQKLEQVTIVDSPNRALRASHIALSFPLPKLGGLLDPRPSPQDPPGSASDEVSAQPTLLVPHPEHPQDKLNSGPGKGHAYPKLAGFGGARTQTCMADLAE